MLERNKPIIIVAVFSILIMGISIFVVTRNDDTDVVQNQETSEEDILAQVRSIHQGDHVLGNPNAPIVFYVYSDFSCSYCKDFHQTMKTLMKMYGTDGQVAWVFRHIPFVQIHPESPMYALASECVAEETGDTGFWKFADALYEQADPLAPLNAADLVLIAEYVGATKQNFVSCMRLNNLMSKVETDFNEAIEAGAKGSPFTVVQTPEQRSVFQGAQSFRTLAIALQTSLRAMDVEVLQSPSSATENMFTDYENDFKTDQLSTSSKPESILDGIITE